MACETILDAFAYATEDLDNHIYKQSKLKSIWLNLIPRSTYPMGVGTTRTVFGVGNNEPTGADTWTSFSSEQLGGAHGACDQTFNDIDWGYYADTYSPVYTQFDGPIVCARNLAFAHNVDDFIATYMRQLEHRASRVWEDRYARDHDTFSRKAEVIADFVGGWKDQAGLTGMSGATGELTQEALEFVSARLNTDGASTPDTDGFTMMTDTGPIYTLYIDQIQSNRILRANADIRQDYRDAFSGLGEGNPLIKRIGATRVIGNFRHIVDPLPPRYTFAGGAYTRVYPYGNDTAETKGSQQIIAAAYRNALYEGARILSKDLFTSEIVAPHNAGLDFDPVSYMGEWIWKTGAYKWDTDCVDPLEERGRHFAVFAHAAKPNIIGRYKLGWLIIYKRCLGNNVDIVTCSS